MITLHARIERLGRGWCGVTPTTYFITITGEDGTCIVATMFSEDSARKFCAKHEVETENITLVLLCS
jgi:hypothetical protein